MSQSTAQAFADGRINLTGGNIGGNATPAWLQITLAAVAVAALIWFMNRKGGG